MKPGPPAFLDDALPQNAAARLAIFGKHPAAADHLEDIGLTTASLVQFKQSFYVDGLGEILSKRRWEKELENADAVPFDHWLLCAGPRGWLLAAFIASSDAKGRRQYPLVAAAHIGGFRSAGSAGEAGDVVRQTLRHAQSASGMETLRAAQSAGQRQLEDKLPGAAAANTGRSARVRVMEACGCPADSEALARVLHALSPNGAGTAKARIHQNCSITTLHALIYSALIRAALVIQRHPVCVTWKHGGTIADLSLGIPGSRTLQNLFSPEPAAPLTPSVPYTIEESMRAGWKEAVNRWLDTPEFFSAPDEQHGGSVIKRICRSVGGLLKLQSRH